MDPVRFGRALGVGAREAAKAALTAADAAASPNPRPASAKAGVVSNAAAKVSQQAVRQVVQAQRTGKNVREGGRRFGEAVWGPFVKLSGVLWLELTGVFFALFALFAGVEAWKDRSNLHATGGNHTPHEHFVVAVAMAVVFGYFCVSSFVSAARRGRR